MHGHHHRIAFSAGIAAASLLLGVALAASAHEDAATRSRLAEEAPFLAENDAAMSRMMAGMAVKPTGDVDRDFVAMMVPHHQGAIDMAGAVLRYGHNEQLRRLAQEIIVTQQQEIAAMRLAVGEPLPPSTPHPTQATRRDSLAATSTAQDSEHGIEHVTRFCSRSPAGRPARGSPAASAGQAPGRGLRPGHPGEPPRPGLRRRAVLEHRLGHRSRPTTRCSASSAWASRSRRTSARSTAARCWCTAWASRPTTGRSRSCRSARTRSPSSTPPPTRSST